MNFEDRRSTERYDVMVPAKVIMDHKEISCIVDNLSAGGAFVGLNRAPEVDSLFDIILEFDSTDNVRLKARVAWKGYRIQHVKTKYLGSIDHKIPGIGINFVSTPAELTENIGRYLIDKSKSLN